MALVSEDQWPWQEPQYPVTKGAFILIEGLDRAGKTTQVKLLCKKLYSLGYNIKTIRFPELELRYVDRTSPTGQIIDKYLKSSTSLDDHAVHLLFSANRWEKAKWIEETLCAGYSIICDRYYFSGVVYSAAKNNPLLTLEWAKASDIGLPRPDAVIFLDLIPQEAEKRAGYGTEKYENIKLQEKAREIFLNLFSSNTDGAYIQVIDASSPVEKVESQIYASIEGILRSVVSGSAGNQVSRLVYTASAVKSGTYLTILDSFREDIT